MTEIEDPWHSRPIDVHKWSDHPAVVQFVDRVWDEYLPEEVIGGRGPKPKMAFRKQLRVLILDLYVAWLVRSNGSQSDINQHYPHRGDQKSRSSPVLDD
jgi:hypothetical protein